MLVTLTNNLYTYTKEKMKNNIKIIWEHPDWKGRYIEDFITSYEVIEENFDNIYNEYYQKNKKNEDDLLLDKDNWIEINFIL